jgi:hypothetical protein
MFYLPGVLFFKGFPVAVFTGSGGGSSKGQGCDSYTGESGYSGTNRI